MVCIGKNRYAYGVLIARLMHSCEGNIRTRLWKKKNEIDGGDRINLALLQDMDKWQAFVNTVMNSRVP